MPANPRMNQRHLARQVAVQAMYWTTSQPWEELRDVIETIGKDRNLATKGRRYAFLICRQAHTARARYEEAMNSSLHNWDPERVGRVERFITILALAEWDLDTEDTPPKVVLTEAVMLAQEFCGEKSAAFINGVLDSLGHRLGKLTGAPRREPAE